MLSQDVYHLSDAAQDHRALGHAFVGELGIRFYAAAPLRTQDGLDLGTVWVLDQTPRELAAGRGGNAQSVGRPRDESALVVSKGRRPSDMG
jgi:hypothetical protein